jgi:pimeloyl-ACP methyl ester carboxylesterase
MESVSLRYTEATIAGIRSPLIEGGTATAEEAVVFVHGSPGSSRDWEDLGAQVSAFARTVALDMPGFGRAQKPEHFDYTAEGSARHLARALTELGIHRVHLVPHDFGGPWGLAWAAAHPDSFASAVLLNTGAWLDYHWHFHARMWQRPVLGELYMAMTSRTSFHLLFPRSPMSVTDREEDENELESERERRVQIERNWCVSPANAADPGASGKADCCPIERAEHA